MSNVSNIPSVNSVHPLGDYLVRILGSIVKEARTARKKNSLPMALALRYFLRLMKESDPPAAIKEYLERAKKSTEETDKRLLTKVSNYFVTRTRKGGKKSVQREGAWSPETTHMDEAVSSTVQLLRGVGGKGTDPLMQDIKNLKKLRNLVEALVHVVETDLQSADQRPKNEVLNAVRSHFKPEATFMTELNGVIGKMSHREHIEETEISHDLVEQHPVSHNNGVEPRHMVHDVIDHISGRLDNVTRFNSTNNSSDLRCAMRTAIVPYSSCSGESCLVTDLDGAMESGRKAAKRFSDKENLIFASAMGLRFHPGDKLGDYEHIFSDSTDDRCLVLLDRTRDQTVYRYYKNITDDHEQFVADVINEFTFDPNPTTMKTVMEIKFKQTLSIYIMEYLIRKTLKTWGGSEFSLNRLVSSLKSEIVASIKNNASLSSPEAFEIFLKELPVPERPSWYSAYRKIFNVVETIE